MGKTMTEPDYSKTPAVEVIDRIIALVGNEELPDGFFNRLVRIRKDVFLELPETRTELLVAVGKLVNRYVPSKADWKKSDGYWYKVRDILNQSFGR